MVDLCLHRFGSDAPTVLLLHGISSAGPVWWRIGDALAAAGYSSAAPDLRGHGDSGHPGEFGLDGYARDVVASCPGPWQLVIGHSLGGAVAVRSAAILPAFSGRYLLIDPAIDFDPIVAETVRSSVVAEVADPPSVEQLLAERPHWDRKDAELKHSALQATSVDVIERSFSDNREWELGRDLAAIAAPVHILGAADEPIYTRDHFANHGFGNPTMTFEVVPETGHSIHRDAPETVVERALGMLRS
jgi:pimeloyl-ACP methyl ester carboxylesterase